MIEFFAKLKSELAYVSIMLDNSDIEKAKKGLLSIREVVDQEWIRYLQKMRVKSEKVRASRGKKALIKLLKKL